MNESTNVNWSRKWRWHCPIPTLCSTTQIWDCFFVGLIECIDWVILVQSLCHIHRWLTHQFQNRIIKSSELSSISSPMEYIEYCIELGELSLQLSVIESMGVDTFLNLITFPYVFIRVICSNTQCIWMVSLMSLAD